MKKGDYVVIFIILLISTTIFIGTAKKIDHKGQKFAVVSVNGEVINKYEIKKTDSVKRYTIDTKYGHNEIEIDSTGVKMLHSNCKDKICLKMKKISKEGQSIICLPNRLVITIEGDEEMDVVLY